VEKEKVISELKNFLRNKAKFALIYGSILTDYFTEDSDIDLGLYLGEKVDRQDRVRIQHDLEKHFDHKYDFDVVLLDCADPIIAMQILANGRLIVEKDRVAFIKYKARMISEYLDFKMDRKIIEDRVGEGSSYA
jgi:predicted nucleotidyltransferase